MPRITADTVAEHVRLQEAAVVRSAARLFAERGVSDVSLADIAADVGLARNSLYRYFPDKAHIFAAWFRTELEPLQAASDEIADDHAPAGVRLDRWLELHLEYLVAPEHQAMMAAAGDSSLLSDDTREVIGLGHAQLYATLDRIVADLVGKRRDPEAAAAYVTGLLRTTADLVIAGSDRVTATKELLRLAHTACWDT